MNKKRVIIAALAVLFLAASAFAVNPNLSIDYVRMLARYATVNSPDAALYNPAGLPKLEDGLYVDISNQFVYKKYSAEIPSIPMFLPNGASLVNSTGTRFTPLFPSANVTFKMDNWAVFATLDIPDGGGKLVYEDVPGAILGSQYETKVEGSSQWFDVTLGGSYAINKYIALSLGVRMLIPEQTSKITFLSTPLGDMVVSDETYKGLGFSGQLGINVTPIEKLNIGILYKSQAFWAKNDKNSVNEPNFYAPNIIQVGIGYDVIDNLNIQFGYKINLEALTPKEILGGQEYKNSMDFTLGAEYQINQYIKPSLGLGYQMGRGTKETNAIMSNMINPDLDAFVVGLGAVITPVKNLNVTLGYMFPFFMKAKNANDVELAKTVHVFGLGISYKFF